MKFISYFTYHFCSDLQILSGRLCLRIAESCCSVPTPIPFGCVWVPGTVFRVKAAREWVLVASEEATDRFADVSDASLERGRFLVGCWFAVSLCVTVSFDQFVQCWRVELFEIVHVKYVGRRVYSNRTTIRRYYRVRCVNFGEYFSSAAHERKIVAQKHVLICILCCSPNDAKYDERCCFVGCIFQGTFKLASAGLFLAILLS